MNFYGATEPEMSEHEIRSMALTRRTAAHMLGLREHRLTEKL